MHIALSLHGARRVVSVSRYNACEVASHWRSKDSTRLPLRDQYIREFPVGTHRIEGPLLYLTSSCHRRYNLLCTVIGGVGLLWVMKGEESDDEDARAEKEHSRNDGDSTDAEDADGRHYDLSVRQEEGKAGNRQASESEAVASNSKFSMCRVKCVCGQGTFQQTRASYGMGTVAQQIIR